MAIFLIKKKEKLPNFFEKKEGGISLHPLLEFGRYFYQEF
jgi:hypothetical protein